MLRDSLYKIFLSPLFFSTGSFYLYYIPDEESWNDLDLRAPMTRVCTGKPLITAISLGHDGTSPAVAVATDDGAISIYKWLPP